MAAGPSWWNPPVMGEVLAGIGSASVATPRRRILLIEDQEAMRSNLALMLELEGYEVLEACDGVEGVRLALEHRPDLVLCDVTMPGLDGHGVVQRLRSEPATVATPFVFLTARGERADFRLGMNLGADDYLTKPLVRAELLAALSARLARADDVKEQVRHDVAGFRPDFSSPAPLQAAFGLTRREAESLLWVAQGKSNAEVGIILGMSEKTVKQHLGSVFQKLGVEGRNAAMLRALEVLSTPPPGGDRAGGH